MNEERKATKKRMWIEKIDNHLYVYHNGKLIYKRWVNKKGEKTQLSILINDNGWPNEWID